MRRTTVLGLLCLGLAAPLGAQSSQFGIRGLGLPGRGLSAGALALQGADGLFDGRSTRNPASVGLLPSATLMFTSTQAWRDSENPGGAASTTEQRFPLLVAGGPIPGVPLWLAISYSNYAVRDFTIVSEGTASPRGIPVAVIDTLGSTGGLNDLRVAAAWTPAAGITVGLGVHLLTGSNRVFTARSWADTAYLPVRQRAELTYAGAGLSAGVILQPNSRLALAGTIRQDGSLDVERDSTGTGSIDLPWTVAASARYRLAERVALSGMVSSQNWSVADAGLGALGGAPARNTVEVAGGLEFVRNVRRPERLPLRIGVRHAELPFLLAEGSQPREFAFSLGTAFRFADDRGGIDLTMERIRRTQGSDYRETAWHLSVGVSLRGVIPSP